MTAAIIYSGLIGVYGFIIGKTFKGLNPFLMLIGMMFAIPVLGVVEQYQQPLLYIPFAIGFITNFASPLRSVFDFFSGIKMDIERASANRRYKKEQKKRQKEYDRQQAEYEKQRAKHQSSHNSYYQQNNNYTHQQAEAEQERLRRQAEELRRQREQFKREQEQAKRNQNSQSSASNDDLNPNIFKDACEILGCKDTDDKATLKKAYKRLSSMYHPDKVEKLGGRRKGQALAEMKLINQAWERVQEKFE